MTESERELERLRYIRTSIELVMQYTQAGREAFFRDTMVQDAVLRRLETLADAGHRLTDALKARHPEVQWRASYGFRNIVAHDYLRVRLAEAWDILQNDLPALRAVVAEEISRAEAG